MSRPDARERITRAAIALGATEGVSAMSLQAIARTAGVSKALLLYHHAGKAALLGTIVETLGDANAARLRRAASAPNAMVAWRALVGDEMPRGELALLSALALEVELEEEPLAVARAMREEAAAALAVAVLASVHLAPRVSPALLGRMLLRQLDGLAATATRGGITPAALDAELDAFALALLALGH